MTYTQGIFYQYTHDSWRLSMKRQSLEMFGIKRLQGTDMWVFLPAGPTRRLCIIAAMIQWAMAPPQSATVDCYPILYLYID